jgi:predicted SnoaL-like aldol condensation-catalyzing enzyme
LALGVLHDRHKEKGDGMPETPQEKNKALLLEGFDVLFNRRDFEAAERYWSPNYVQHSAHIPPGRAGLFNLVKELPANTKYEHGVIMAEGDFVMAHGRYSNPNGTAIVVVDIMRIKDGVFQEHWDVIQEEATKEQSKSGLPMFGDEFPKEHLGGGSQSESELHSRGETLTGEL